MSLLQHLPAEVLGCICTHLIPTGHTFRLRCRDPQAKIDAPHTSTGAFPFSQSELPPQSPAVVFSDYNIDIFTILLLHSKIYPHVVECLYSRNVFFPPDLTTLLALRASWCPLAVSSVRKIRIDACGPGTRHPRGYQYFYSWSQSANPDIACIPGLFPGIRELRLGGVGPGAVYRRSFTYRGLYCARETEVCDAWTTDNLRLVTNIVGCNVASSLGDVELGSSEMMESHALSRGQVFCMHYDESVSGSPPRGLFRLHGTRIIRRGEVMKQGLDELDLVDIDAALQRTRDVHAEFTTSGHSELTVDDTQWS